MPSYWPGLVCRMMNATYHLVPRPASCRAGSPPRSELDPAGAGPRRDSAAVRGGLAPAGHRAPCGLACRHCPPRAQSRYRSEPRGAVAPAGSAAGGSCAARVGDRDAGAAIGPAADVDGGATGPGAPRGGHPAQDTAAAAVLAAMGGQGRRTVRSLRHEQAPAKVERAKTHLAMLRKGRPQGSSSASTTTSAASRPVSL